LTLKHLLKKDDEIKVWNKKTKKDEELAEN